jgi:zinc and cadmium transporter
MSHGMWLVIYCVLILIASLAGGWIPMFLKLTHRRMEFAVSFVGGVMLGVGVLHMLPHAILARAEALPRASTVQAAETSAIHNHDHDDDQDHDHDHDEPGHAHDHAGHSPSNTSALDHAGVHDLLGPILLWLLAGFLVMFFIERFFCFHHHDAPPTSAAPADHSHHDHDHAHDHHHHHHSHSHGHAPSKHHLTWTGAAIGLSIHSLIEGIALAASVEIGRQHAHSAVPVGLATFLVIFLHKPFDSLTLGTLMGIGGRSAALRHLINAAFAALIPAGALLFYFGVAGDSAGGNFISAALAFSAGTFLCIAMSDLLPELQFHQHDRLKLSLSLLAGLALAWVIAVLESNMAH